VRVAEERSRPGRYRQKPEQPPEQIEDEQVLTATQLLAGAAIPIRLNLRYELTTARPEGIEEVIPESVLDKISERQEHLVRWMQRDHAHRVQFLIDPLGALKEVGIELEADERDALIAVHDMNASSEILPPGVEVATVSVDLAEPSTEQPASHEDGPNSERETEGG
jgi:hypothetical protein